MVGVGSPEFCCSLGQYLSVSLESSLLSWRLCFFTYTMRFLDSKLPFGSYILLANSHQCTGDAGDMRMSAFPGSQPEGRKDS